MQQTISEMSLPDMRISFNENGAVEARQECIEPQNFSREFGVEEREVTDFTQLASVGLLVSGSHDSGEIAGNLMMLFAACDMRPGDAGAEAISESHKCMDLSPADGSSVHFFSSEP